MVYGQVGDKRIVENSEKTKSNIDFFSVWSDITSNSERMKIATEQYCSGDVSFLGMLEIIAEEVMEEGYVPEEKQEE